MRTRTKSPYNTRLVDTSVGVLSRSPRLSRYGRVSTNYSQQVWSLFRRRGGRFLHADPSQIFIYSTDGRGEFHPSSAKLTPRALFSFVICPGVDAHGGNVQNGCGKQFSWSRARPYQGDRGECKATVSPPPSRKHASRGHGPPPSSIVESLNGPV